MSNLSEYEPGTILLEVMVKLYQHKECNASTSLHNQLVVATILVQALNLSR